MGLFDFFSKNKKEQLDKGLEKTKTNFFSKLAKAIIGKSKVDDEVLDNLEEILIASDVGVSTTLKIIERIENRIARDKYLGTDQLNGILKEEIVELLKENKSEGTEKFEYAKTDKPYVIMVVGVNGVGKTTTIAKLAYQFKAVGNKVYLGAADTFRAAAVDQLKIWATRVNVPIIAQGMGADPASVAFDTLSSAKANDADVVIIDTAGRLHTQHNLMAELEKLRRILSTRVAWAPHETLLVMDAATGQNGLAQAKQFTKSVKVTGIILAKLDGSAKGGMALSIGNELGMPIRFVGTGEKMGDFAPFDPQAFAEGLLRPA